jgi:hypothetical protein
LLAHDQVEVEIKHRARERKPRDTDFDLVGREARHVVREGAVNSARLRRVGRGRDSDLHVGACVPEYRHVVVRRVINRDLRERRRGDELHDSRIARHE